MSLQVVIRSFVAALALGCAAPVFAQQQTAQVPKATAGSPTAPRSCGGQGAGGRSRRRSCRPAT